MVFAAPGPGVDCLYWLSVQALLSLTDGLPSLTEIKLRLNCFINMLIVRVKFMLSNILIASVEIEVNLSSHVRSDQYV